MKRTMDCAWRTAPSRCAYLLGAVLGLAVARPSGVAVAQEARPDSSGGRPHHLEAITVTASRTPTDVFLTPNPVLVIDTAWLREKTPNNAADLFRDLPGLDVNGVGPNQTRPTIRGQRGQRILLLEDGVRLNNTRRQQDFGEIPAIVDVAEIQRVEIVRGPASVLYGTDAIGGVVNLITDRPLRSPTGNQLWGRLGYRYSSEDTQHKPVGSLHGSFGRLGFGVAASYRETRPYLAPAGRFGDIRLDQDTRVHDTGVQDESYDVQLGYRLSDANRVFVNFDRYRAEDAGFGYVDAAAYGGGGPKVQILYPFQRVDKLTLGYRASGMGSAVADRLEITGYTQSNERQLNLDVFVPFGPPGSGVQVNTENFTDLDTYGFRAEAAKILAGRHVLTYGLDFFRDDSKNTDVSQSTVTGFGPPQTSTDSTPLVPNAIFRSAGAFVQGEVVLTDRLRVILGTRYQDIHTETRPTPRVSDPPVESTDRTVVGSANLSYLLTPSLNLVGAVGRAFRSPNLVERFFNGITPEGSGFQSRNPDLEPETSLNVDFGIKYRLRNVYLEGFVFRNSIRNGIRIQATGDTVAGFPEFQNVNIDKLRFTGVELLGDVSLGRGFSAGANYTHLASKDVENPNNPVGETYSNKIGIEARYRETAGRFWASYSIRHNGEQKDVLLGASPVGDRLPAFTVHTVRGGMRVFHRGAHSHSIGVTVANLTNELYAEFANASFFRPEPKRNVILTYAVTF